VALKFFESASNPHEIEIGQYLSSEELTRDDNNYCVPILEVLRPPTSPDCPILVMPLLKRNDQPRFDTVGEVVEFLRQYIEVKDDTKYGLPPRIYTLLSRGLRLCIDIT
jgi:hypothetical protein